MSKMVEMERVSRPMPLSRTRTTASSSSCFTSSSMRPPGSVYLAALCSRLPTTWASRAASPSTGSGASVTRTSSAWRRDSMNGRTVSSASRTASRRSMRALRTANLPVVMRETSSRSSTSRTICRSWRSIMSSARWRISGVVAGVRMISSALRKGASGLRSSCARVARNSSLRRSASRSASARRPASASMPLKASTSSPISSSLVFFALSE